MTWTRRHKVISGLLAFAALIFMTRGQWGWQPKQAVPSKVLWAVLAGEA